MPAFTVQDIVDRAAAAADMHGDFVTAAQWLAWYKVEHRALELFVARSGWVTNLASTVDASSFTITVPAPFAILGVYEVRDSKYRPLKFQNQVDFTKQAYSSPAETGDAYTYSLLTSTTTDDVTIHMFPKPTSGTYRCLYIPTSTLPTALTSSITWPLGWEERIVLGMARRALEKEESDSRFIQKQMAEWDSVIEEFCFARQLADAPRVRNVDYNERGWLDSMFTGSYEAWHWF